MLINTITLLTTIYSGLSSCYLIGREVAKELFDSKSFVCRKS